MATRNLLIALSLGLGLAGAANAQVISYSPRTGDVWVDNQLGYYNDYGRDNRQSYVDDIVSTFGAPRYLVNDLLTTRRWNPGDVYYACALAYETRRSCGDVVQMYDQNRGQGWGVVAQRLGIKPGSAQFHALKGQMGKSRTRYTSDASAHGPVGNGPGNSGGDHGGSGKGHGDAGAAHGKSGKGQGHGHGGDHGNGGGHGHGNGGGNGHGGGHGKGH